MNEGRKGCDKCGDRGHLRYISPERGFHCEGCRELETRDFKDAVQNAQQALATEDDQTVQATLEEDKAPLDFARQLLATTRVLSEKKFSRIPDTIRGVVASSLFAKMFGTYRALVKLSVAGHTREVPSLTRSALEALINLRFITLENCEEPRLAGRHSHSLSNRRRSR
jgi:hypothetical protein